MTDPLQVASLPPGPRRPPTLQTVAWMTRPAEFMTDCRRRFGKRFTARFVGGRAYVFLTAPEDVKAVFTAPTDTYASANASMRPFLGDDSMFVLDGDKHRRHRRLIGPTMRGDRLKEYAPMIRDATLARVRHWREGSTERASDLMRDITLGVIFETVFGESDHGRAEELKQRLVDLLSGTSPALLFIPALHVDLGPRSPWGAFLRKRAELWRMLVAGVDRARRGEAAREDVLIRMVREGRAHSDPLGDDEIAAELVTLLGAGHETSTAGLAWAFHWILGDASVRERVVAEVRGATDGVTLTADALDRMPFLEACVQESLRIVPVIPLVPRLLAREMSLDGATFAPGTFLSPCPYLTHRDPDTFAEPMAFRPERFLGKRYSSFKYYPFGGGHRHCIGASFALFEMKCVLATVFATSDVALASEGPTKVVRQGVTLTTKDRTPLTLVRRAQPIARS